jgi:hypothetical protein
VRSGRDDWPCRAACDAGRGVGGTDRRIVSLGDEIRAIHHAADRGEPVLAPRVRALRAELDQLPKDMQALTGYQPGPAAPCVIVPLNGDPSLN